MGQATWPPWLRGVGPQATGRPDAHLVEPTAQAGVVSRTAPKGVVKVGVPMGERREGVTRSLVPRTGGWPETREEFLERLRSTPTKLCRLRYFGGEDRWGFAFYTYGNERYELSVFPSGEFLGPPEEAFGVSAGAYLR